MVEVNYIAILLATVSSMVVGSVWYTPKVFGNAWMKLAKINKKDVEGGSAWLYVGAFLLSLITAYVLAHLTALSNTYFGNSYVQDALTTAFWVWLGFTAARIAMHDMFEGRSYKLTVLNVVHELVTLEIMALIIGLMGVAK